MDEPKKALVAVMNAIGIAHDIGLHIATLRNMTDEMWEFKLRLTPEQKILYYLEVNGEVVHSTKNLKEVETFLLMKMHSFTKEMAHMLEKKLGAETQ
jgi:hypothetical protein